MNGLKKAAKNLNFPKVSAINLDSFSIELKDESVFSKQINTQFENLIKQDRISEFKDKYGYLYQDDYESMEGFNKNVFYADNLAGYIDLEPIMLGRTSDLLRMTRDPILMTTMETRK